MVPRYTIKAAAHKAGNFWHGILSIRKHKKGDFCKYSEVAPELDRIEPLEMDLVEMTERTNTWRALCHKQEQTIIDLKHQLALCGVMV